MLKRLKIAVLIDSSRSYRRGLLRGVAAYARAHGPWSFYHHERDLGNELPRELLDWDGDGIIVRTEDPGLIRQIEQTNLPTVGEFGPQPHGAIPAVEADYQDTARLAADHLLERGFEHFAYFGFAGRSDPFYEHFAQRVGEAGFQATVYEGQSALRTAELSTVEESAERQRMIAKWIEALAKPLGLMACNDMCASQVLRTCGEYDIAVPDDVAVIGVDDDEVLCELSSPPLSSIDPDAEEIGYQTAALLHRIIRRKPPPTDTTFVKPKGVVARQSTEVFAIADRDTAAAMHLIRRHACDGIGIGDVTGHVGLSRSTLERRFARFVGHSPKAEIRRVRIGRVKELLATTDFTLDKIAELTGFDYTQSMCDLFKRMTGRTPGQYRKEHQP